MIVQYSFAPIHKNNLAHIGVYEYLLKLIEGDENISRWTMENVVILKNQNSNNYKTKGQKMKVNFKNTMELSEEAINEVVTSEEGLYLMHEQNYSKSMLLAKKIYEICKNFPQEEIYGLTSQIKRSAISVPSNIAEGKGRGTNKDFIYFLRIALGSLYELQTQLELAYEFDSLII